MGDDNKYDNSSNHDKIIDYNDDDVRQQSPSTTISTTSSVQQQQQQQQQQLQPNNQSDQLRIAMDIVDTIRRYEKVSNEQSTSNIVKTTSNNNNNNYQGLRNWINTPGIQMGCITACCGIITMIPLRRQLLYRMNQYLKLDTSFTDLIITPTITVVIAQCSVYVGTLYGSLYYLNQLSSSSSSISESNRNSYSGITSNTTSLSSSTITDICNDAVLVNASKTLSLNDDVQKSNSLSSSQSFLKQYDLQNNVTIALHNSIRACDERRDSIINEEI